MIDDGSPDNCPDICEEYARYYQNFHVIHKKNGGLSSARNIGLDSAKGRYITFYDPDDFYMPNTISRYTEIAQMGGADIVVGYYNIIQNDTVTCKSQHRSNNVKILNRSDALCLIEDDSLGGWTWNKLFLKEIIDKHNLRFNLRYSNHEDKLFFIEYFQYVDEVMIIPDIVYNYCIRSNSLTSQYNNINMRVDALKSSMYVIDRLNLSRKAYTQELRWCGSWLKIYIKKIWSYRCKTNTAFSDKIRISAYFLKIAIRYVWYRCIY